jgi:outer membrane protein OmpA-like peptidoglycan-associated protein
MLSPWIERLIAISLVGVAAAAGPRPADAQFPDLIEDAAKSAAEREVSRQVEAFVASAVKCAFDNFECIRTARENDEDVVLTDEDGDVIYDDEGQPVTDPAQLPEDRRPPGAGADANYDFEAGTDVIFEEDYAADNVGDFPRALEFVKGNWEVVEWTGRRLLRNLGPRGAAFRIRLPETLPERFTLETEVHLPHGNQQLAVFTRELDGRLNDFDGQYFQIAGDGGTGVLGRGTGTVESTQDDGRLHEEILPVRVMVDGTYAKVYVGENRVANVPNAEFARTRVLQVQNTYFADEENPILVGPIRVAAGGRDLYDVLEAKGRVAVQDIHFDTNSADIRPESAEALQGIGQMLQEHPGLKLVIEGHTDDQGEFDHNMQLSSDRAAAVKAWLVENHGIEGVRLRTMGLGPTQPVAGNDTAEGRQENRRVELVRIGD